MQVAPNQSHAPSVSASTITRLGDDVKPEVFTKALSKAIMQQPFYAVLLMDQLKVVWTTSVPTMGTDGIHIFVNPTFVETLTVDECMFVICHEVLHFVFQHMARGKLYKDRGLGPDLKPYSHTRMNKAADYIINDILIRGKVGKMPSMGLHDVAIANFDDLADEVYINIPEDPPQEGGGGGHGNFDEHLDPEAGTSPPSEAEVQRAVAQAANAAKARGKLPAELERLVGEILEPTKPWAELLRDEMMACIGTDESTWARPNRRRIVTQPAVYMPGKQGYATGTVVVQIDTSGSVSNAELTAFLSETSGILADANPEEVIVLWTDSRVAGVDYVSFPEELEDLTPKGGGGTDMRAGVEWCVEHEIAPSCFVCLTDGWTPYPEECDFKTIWVVSDKSTDEAPVGKTIYLTVTGGE